MPNRIPSISSIPIKNPKSTITAAAKAKDIYRNMKLTANTADGYDSTIVAPADNSNSVDDKTKYVTINNRTGLVEVTTLEDLFNSGNTYQQSLPLSTNYQTKSNENEQRITDNLNPFDPRLIFGIDKKTGAVVYSMSAQNEHPLIDGFIFPDEKNRAYQKSGYEISDDEAKSRAKEFYGVPSIFNPNAYINLQGAGGYGKNKYILEKENAIRWYNASEPTYGDGSGVQPSSAPTVTEIIAWSSNPKNAYKFPYKFTDFAFCKWWKKIPNNYMITLRRYPYPINDSVTSSDEAAGNVKLENLKPISTMITFLGEESGNKISSILGTISTGLNWGEAKAQVWEVNTQVGEQNINNPGALTAKIAGFLQSGAAGYKDEIRPPVPLDPYSNGPYANRVLGPLNVINSTKKRETGLVFEHSISLVFEYSLRSIGSINTKAAGLDIISNAMLMGSATAPFWGGANRYMPAADTGGLDPFLGGKAGRSAWLNGNPEGFFNALKEQYTDILSNISEIFNQITGISSIDSLQQIAAGAGSAVIKDYMKLTTTKTKSIVEGIHSILTGAPVGEWHVCVGAPQNPMMMMGNMICTKISLDFSDELGPDDFPTEIKITVELDHGMPRDRDGIESMFNKGRGRIYSLPKGYEESISSAGLSDIDRSTNKPLTAEEKRLGTTDRLLNEKYDFGNTSTKPIIGTVFGAKFGLGYAHSKNDKQENAKKANENSKNE